MMRRSMSFLPSNGSMMRPSSGSNAMALTVKSRRARSAVMSLTNSTVSGRRPSEYAPSPRNVVTSNGFPSMSTVTVPCWMPVGMTREKIVRSSGGFASVVTSQSDASLPTSRSRTHPPTT
jgi:hypothetical protein